MIRSRPDGALACLSEFILAGLVAAVCLARPGGSTAFLPPCPFHALTGFYCPSCGSTRMLFFLVQGHPYLAFRENPLAFVVLPAVIYGIGLQLLTQSRGLFLRVRPGWVRGFCVVVILFTVLRNIPYAPFSALAPAGEPSEAASLKVAGFNNGAEAGRLSSPVPSLSATQNTVRAARRAQ